MEPESITKILWREAKAGDRSAYERLFALHVDRLLIFVRARLGGALREKMEAEDVVQDAYVSALRSFDEFDYTDDGAFLRWMCRIIDNRLRDAHDYFSAKKRREVALPKSAPTGPVTALGRAENRQQVEAALARLSEDHREVLLLRYFEGLSAEEAGQRMKRSPGAIRNLSARALVELGKLIEANKENRT
jgi:RNA polymerase sigma-70 factor (ECF subfamily)